MNMTLFPIRLVFILICAAGGWLVCYSVDDWDKHRVLATFFGLSIGILIVLVDIMLKGFSLRGLSAITFGLAMGVLLSYLVGVSPLFARGDEQIIFIAKDESGKEGMYKTGAFPDDGLVERLKTAGVTFESTIPTQKGGLSRIPA